MDLQGYLAPFALTGDPSNECLPQWPEFGQNATAINFTIAGIQNITSDAVNSRCMFWKEAEYFPKLKFKNIVLVHLLHILYPYEIDE